MQSDATKHFLAQNLRCPDCHEPALVSQKSDVRCDACNSEFPIFNGSPVLLRHDNEVFPPDMYKNAKLPSENAKQGGLTSLIPRISVNLVNSRCLTDISRKLSGQEDVFILVVGSSTQRTWLNKYFESSANLHLVCCDIDTSAFVDCYCDAHELPFRDNCFDGLIITAVLELVLYPERVAAELHRVLKPGAILYSELPFMQQVHEGAYDFTRFTLSGHRRLFNRFCEIESGMVAGPATVLVWSIENLVLAFLSGKKIRKIAKALVRCTLFWIKYLDYLLVNKPQAMDGASCTFFMGEKMLGTIADKEIIARYIGGKQLEHV